MDEHQLKVYRASAGSGKTFTLTAEYISLLLSGDSGAARHILAVTFTNKATAEMKNRILENLYAIAHTQLDASGEPTEFGDMFEAVRTKLNEEISARTMCNRAARALSEIVHDYDRFFVTTIDSFLQSTLQNVAREIGLTANYGVNLDDVSVIEKAVGELLTNIDDNASARRWIRRFVEERVRENERWNVANDLKSFAKQLGEEIYMRHSDELDEAMKGNAVANFEKSLAQLAHTAADPTVAAAEHLLKVGGDWSRFSRGNDVQKVITRIAEGNFTSESAAQFHKFAASSDVWQKAADKKKRLYQADVEQLQPLLSNLEEMRDLAEKVVNTCRATRLNLYKLRLLHYIDRKISEINQEHNRIMLRRTPLLFHKLVGKNDAGFVFEKAGLQFNHIMIDEFQDTSGLQWENFKHLLIENLGRGETCMLVGDVKQSIYRWRGGDWGILSEIENEMDARRLETHTLSVNYRSGSRIVAFNNMLFARAAAYVDTLVDKAYTGRIQQIYADVEQLPRIGADEGHVRVAISKNYKWAFSSCGQEDEAACDRVTAIHEMLTDMGQKINELHSTGLPYREMAILIRTSKDGKAVLTHFTEEFEHIPLVSDDAFLLSSSPAVEFLVGLLQVLVHPEDMTALTFVTECYQHEILHADRQAIPTTKEQWEALLPTSFIEERERLKRLPLYELCERLIEIFKIGSMPGQTVYLFALLDLVISFLDNFGSSIVAFLDFCKEKLSETKVPASSVDGVRIITIHSAKGLAFHTVFLPFCNWDVTSDAKEKDNTLWVTPQVEPFNKMPLLPVRPEKALSASFFAEDYALEQFRRAVDNLNLLYVATTRPRHNLYMWVLRGNQGKIDSAIEEAVGPECDSNPIVYTSGKPVGATERNASSNEGTPGGNPFSFRMKPISVALTQSTTAIEFKQSNASRRFLLDEDKDAQASLQNDYIKRGSRLHELLSRIATPDDIQLAAKDMRREGFFSSDEEAEHEARFLEERTRSKHVGSWFDGSWELYNECTILKRQEGGHVMERRPDRVMVLSNCAKVVDFKFGYPRIEHSHQVKEYVELMRSMGYAQVEGYIWYVYTNRVETIQ